MNIILVVKSACFFLFISDTKEASKLLERATRLLNSDPDSKLSLKDLLVGDSDSDTEQESTSKKAEETSKKESGGKKKAGRPPATSTAASKTSTTSKTSPASKKTVKPPTPGTRRSSRNRGKNQKKYVYQKIQDQLHFFTKKYQKIIGIEIFSYNFEFF